MKKSGLLLLLMCGILLGTVGCGEDSSSKDDIAPQVPIVVPRSDDAIYPQQGIRPEPTGSSRLYWVHFEWQHNPETDVAGYIIRRGAVDTLFDRSYPVADLSYEDDDIDPDETIHSWTDQGFNNQLQPAELLAPDPVTGDTRGYYWQILAYDESGNRSALSDSVFFRLIENPFDLTVERVGPGSYRISWNYAGDEFMSYYKIRVYSVHGGIDDWRWDPPVYRRYESQIDDIFLNEDGSARPFERDCTYVCQLNAVPTSSNSGSAVFTTFVYED